MSMKVLFVPLVEGPPGHLIPLLALNRMLKGSSIKTAFLVPKRLHSYLRQMGVEVVDIDYKADTQARSSDVTRFDPKPFRMELAAYHKFKPDIVVDDTNPTTYFVTALTGVARLTIQRTGIFPGGEPRNKTHRHSLGMPDVSSWPDATVLGIPQPQCPSDLFCGAIKIVPGVRSIEVLPEGLKNDPAYRFAGPLLMDDAFLSTGYVSLGGHRLAPGTHSANNAQIIRSLDGFLNRNKYRRAIFLTVGTIAKAYEEIYDCVRCLLNQDIAVLSTIKLSGLTDQQQELYYYAPWLPMNYVSSAIDLMVHHCGSGTYHYPIIHGLPSITIGTGCYDREDVAMRLQELNASTHVPWLDDDGNFKELFLSVIDKYFENSATFLQEQKTSVRELKSELVKTSESFNFANILDETKQSSPASRIGEASQAAQINAI